MDIQSIDNYVWEHYSEKITIQSFKSWLADKHTIYGWVWLHTLRDHAKVKEEEHRRISKKLCTFKNSLTDALRACVDPFIDQQENICCAYHSIYLYFAYKAGTPDISSELTTLSCKRAECACLDMN